jgi:hypothetical protein
LCSFSSGQGASIIFWLRPIGLLNDAPIFRNQLYKRDMSY